jgi:rubrerythrin
MPVFICKFCNYRTNKSAMPDKCPYCSKKGVMAEEESADDILSDSE